MCVEDPTLYEELMASEYADQVAPLLERNDGDIDESFLGFTGTYRLLAQLIPTGRTVIDLGCSSAFQGWYFRNHDSYIGVDVGGDYFRVKNGVYYTMTIQEFVEQYREICTGRNVFAICNYVPPWGADNEKLVRETFRNLYVFYPERGDHPEDAELEHRMLG